MSPFYAGHPRVRRPVIVLFVGTHDLTGNYSVILDGTIEFAMKHNAHEVIALGGESNCSVTVANLMRDYFERHWQVYSAQMCPGVDPGQYPVCPRFHAVAGFEGVSEKVMYLKDWLVTRNYVSENSVVKVYSHWRQWLYGMRVRFFTWLHLRRAHDHVHVHET